MLNTETVEIAGGHFSILDRTEGMALPQPTLSRVFAEFRLLKFGRPNANGDGFLASDVVPKEHVRMLVGTPIWLDQDASDHPLKDERATKRAPFYVGAW